MFFRVRGWCAVMIVGVAGVFCALAQPRGGESEPGTTAVNDYVFGALPADSGVLAYPITADTDDGTETNHLLWEADGHENGGLNRIGVADGERFALGLRFHAPGVRRGETFAYARLLLPAADAGQSQSGISLRISGFALDGVPSFANARPSELPPTGAAIDWAPATNWPAADLQGGCTPVRRYTPDLAPVINAIVSRPNWGRGPEGKTLGLLIEDAGSGGVNFVAVHDRRTLIGNCPGTDVAPVLELYRTVRSTFYAKELLGRPTANSVTINAASHLTLELYYEYGTVSGSFPTQTPPVVYPGDSPSEVTLEGLAPNTRYYYRMRFRVPGEGVFWVGPTRTFCTQRAAGEPFRFTVTSDLHLEERIWAGDAAGLALARRSLRNALADGPDFHLDLGDTFFCESYLGRDVVDFEEAVQRHTDVRPFFDLLGHSAALFCVLGNHEGEQGWRLDGTPDNVAVWAANARKLYYPNPVPDGFFTGNEDEVPFVGQREDYYAWHWGDALFVVLDPFWYTAVKPHGGGEAPGSNDNWDWTLGKLQYDWLAATLAASTARYKFVFSHQVTGGTTTYGRGGVEAAKFAVAGLGSFEWGGEDADGLQAFDRMRPGWAKPVHDLFRDFAVTIFFHGHDHVFVKQELDGVVYLECPQPSDAFYRSGHYQAGYYLIGDKINNSGHIRVQVDPQQVTCEYVRAYLPGDGPNGEVAYSFVVSGPP